MENRLGRHIANLLTAVAIIAVLYYLVFKGKAPLEGLQTVLYVGLVAVGLGLVIFIHELGHFLAAKLCDTKVEVFSIGFGPPIPGCHFQYGETLYKLAVFPLGGYVKMPGENPGDVPDEEAAKDPRLLSNKSVGQRMLIFSAGVVMNVILGCVFFVIVYLNGKKEAAPILGTVEAGSPAARAGIQVGSRLLEVNGNTKPTYVDLFFETALSRPNKTEIYLRWRTPAGEEREGIVIPRKLAKDLKPLIGIDVADTLTLGSGKIEDGGKSRPLQSSDFGIRGTPAASAGFEAGDTLIGVRATAMGGEFAPLKSGYDRLQAEFKYRKESIDFQVRRGDGTAVLTVKPRLFHTFGLRLQMGPIVSMATKYAPATAQQLKKGDLIQALDGKADFDPMQFPDLFMDAVEARETVTLTVLRGGKPEAIVLTSAELRGRGTWNEERPISLSAPVGVPALGIAYRVEPVIMGVDANAPPELEKLKGGTLTQINLTRADGTEQEYKIGPEETQWPYLFWLLQRESSKTMKLYVEKGGEPGIEKATAYEAEGWFVPDRGTRFFEPETQLVVADGVLDAVRLGAIETGRFIVRIYMNLRSLLVGDLHVKHLSGPIEMFKMTYTMAESGPVNLILFLGIISVNLAVVNFLPIPILDGGHVMFLIFEKIRGKPASERVFVVANIIGLSFIALLMLFVVFLDFSKMVWVQRLFGL